MLQQSLSCSSIYPQPSCSLVSAAKTAVRRGGNGPIESDQSSVIPAERVAGALRFDAIFVDEAGQCSEPEILTPLRYAFSGYGLRAPPVKGLADRGGYLRIPVRGTLGGRGGGGFSSVQPWAIRQACVRLVLVGDPLQVRGQLSTGAALSALGTLAHSFVASARSCQRPFTRRLR